MRSGLEKPSQADAAQRYDGLSRDELLRLLLRRDRERRLGLVWERERFGPDRGVNDDFVVFDYEPDVSVVPADGGPFRHLIIEGENYDALRALRATLAGRVRCILIDPPYNTGARDWSYDDDRIDPNDAYRQSKWLEWLWRRLVIARDLLASDGVLMACIDDDNRARLELLLDQVMPGRRVGSLVWKSRIGGNDTRGAFLSRDHEHVLIYAGPHFAFGGRAKSFAMYANPDGDLRGPWRKSDLTSPKTRHQRPNSYYPLRDPATGVWYPCNPDRVWAYASRATIPPGRRTRSPPIEDLIADRRIIFPQGERIEVYSDLSALLAAIDRGHVPTSGTGVPLLRRDQPRLEFFVGKPIGWGTPAYRRYQSDLRTTNQPLSSWIKPTEEDPERGVGRTEEGSRLLKQIIQGRSFDYPKPLSLFRELVRQATSEDDIVLDFFAGSGTTAHAVLAANAEDGAQRRFILVGDTERTANAPIRNISRDIAADRVAKVIAGYGFTRGRGDKVEVEGLGGDFAYLRCRRIPWTDVAYELDQFSVWLLIQIAAETGLRLYDEDLLVQRAERPSGLVLYVPSATPEALAELSALAVERPAVIYTWTPSRIAGVVQRPGLAIEALPDALFRDFPRASET